MLAMMLCVGLTATVRAASMSRWTDQFTGFHNAKPEDFRLHKDDHGGYGESFFLQAYNGQGEVLIVLLSVTNYHPFKSYMQSVDLQWVPADGTVTNVHDEVAQKHLVEWLPTGGVAMGKHRAHYTKDGGRLVVDTEEVKAEIQFTNIVPPVRQGDGALKFEGGKTHWTLFVQAPFAKVQAKILIHGQETIFQGLGYADHGWATEKVPDFSKEWHRLRYYDPTHKLGLSFFQILPEEKYGTEPLTQVIVSKDDRVLGIFARAKFTPQARRIDSKSKYPVPSSYAFEIEGNGVKLAGEIGSLERKIDIDVLGSLSWMTRKVLKTFYSNPWQHVSLGTLKVRGEIHGQPISSNGSSMVSAEFYN
jgi:hypothetical protein